LKREQLELLSSRLQDTSTQAFKMKQSVMDGYNIGDTMFDPLEKKKKGKEKVPEMEFLKTLDPAEKEALLKSLEKQRKKKKKRDKAEKAKLKEELKMEIAKATMPKLEAKPDIDIKQEQADSDMEDEETGPAVEITIPKRKDEIEAEKNLAAKKAFARQLASLYSTLKKEESDSDSSDSDDSDSDTDSSDVDSDYETKSSGSSDTQKPGSSKQIVNPDSISKKMAPPPKKGMVLVRKKKTNQAEIKANEEMEKKKKMLAYTQALRKKMAELQEAEVAKSVEKASSKKKTSSTSRAPLVTDEDLTSGLLDVVPQTSKKPSWNKVPVVNYGSSSDEE